MTMAGAGASSPLDCRDGARSRSEGSSYSRFVSPACRKTPIPREARDGLMRAWVALLHEKHPGVTWMPATPSQGEIQ
jgi:hypothetical protein